MQLPNIDQSQGDHGFHPLTPDSRMKTEGKVDIVEMKKMYIKEMIIKLKIKRNAIQNYHQIKQF